MTWLQCYEVMQVVVKQVNTKRSSTVYGSRQLKGVVVEQYLAMDRRV